MLNFSILVNILILLILKSFILSGFFLFFAFDLVFFFEFYGVFEVICFLDIYRLEGVCEKFVCFCVCLVDCKVFLGVVVKRVLVFELVIFFFVDVCCR